MNAEDIEDYYPLTPLQQGMLFHRLAEPGSGLYHDQVVVDFDRRADAAHLESAIQALVDRHPVLRTYFAWEGLKEPIQAVLRAAAPRILLRDWSGLSHVDGERRFDAYRIEDARDEFDLGAAPLARFSICELPDRKRLMISYSHLLLDGGSCARMCRDLRSIYDALASGNIPPPGSAASYKAYVKWLRRQDPLEAERFWKGYLDGFDEPILLADAARPGHAGAAEQKRDERFLGAELTSELGAFSKSARISLNTFFQAAWGLLLSLYTRADDLAFGIVVSNRPAELADGDASVGLFINTVPVRMKIPPAAPVEQWLGSLQKDMARVRSFSYAALSQIRAWSAADARSQLFDTLFVFENSLEASGRGGATDFPYFSKNNYPLTAIVVPGDRIRLRFEYSAEAFDDAFMLRLQDRFELVLATLARSAGKTTGELEFVSRAERDRLLRGFNDTAKPYPQDARLHQLFEEQARKTPLSIALARGDRGMTFAELDARSNGLARTLRERRDVKPDTVVGLCLDRSFEMVVGILGILKAGGAYLPIDPRDPADRIAFLLNDAGARTLLVAGANPVGDAFDGEALDLAESGAYSKNCDAIPAANSPSDLAYVIYTSGSTGAPKGAMLEHAGVVNRLLWMRDAYGIGERDVILQKTVFTFDVSVWELLLPLICGSKLALLEPNAEGDPEAIDAAIDAYGVTTMHFVPSMLSAFLGWLPGRRAYRSLKRVVCSGEALAVAQKDLFFDRIEGDVELHNLYGPTEASIDVTACQVRREDDRVPIGKPVANTRLYVLGRGDALCPVGAPGELCIAGVQLARGYLNRPELTAEKFPPDPFEPGRRMYRTGDLARWLEDGSVEYLGRIDQQVKVRGLRIELGEVESALLSQPGISEAVVAARELLGEVALVAYYVSRAAVDAAALRAGLARRLPQRMIPTHFVALEEIPRTASGKANRKALPEPSGASETSDFALPRDEIERALASVWEEVLGIARVGVRDDYFALGGDSIKAIQVVSRLRGKGYSLKVADVFDRPRIADLRFAVGRSAREIPQGPASGTVPLSPIMRWFFEAEIEDRNHWNQAVMLRSVERLDEAALRKALAVLARHHDGLRLVLAADGRSLVYAADCSSVLALGVHEMRGRADVAVRIRDAAARAQAGFDLTRGPLSSASLFRADDGDHLLLAIHHLLVDGVSWRILLEDLGSAYDAAVADREAELPPKTDSFAAWMKAIDVYAKSAALLGELDYWKGVCARPQLALPLGSRSATGRVVDRALVSVELDADLSEALAKGAGRAYRAEINDLLLAALEVAMRRWLGEEGCLLVNMEGHGREEAVGEVDVTRSVGWFTSQYPFLLDTSGDGDLGLRIRTVKERFRRVPAKGIGYGILRHVAEIDDAARRSLSVSPSISFNYLGALGAEAARSGFAASPYGAGPTVAASGRLLYALDFNGALLNSKLSFSIGYDGSRYRKGEVDTLGRRFREALEEIRARCLAVSDPSPTPSDFGAPWLDLADLDTLAERLGVPLALVQSIHEPTPMQSGMLYHQLADDGSGAYVVQMLLRLEGHDARERFEPAFRELAGRHEALRSRFVADVGDRPLQVFLATPVGGFFREDWSRLSAEEQEGRMRATMEKERHEGFDLAAESPVRFRLVDRGEGRRYLLASHHHIVMDGWCLPVILKEYFHIARALEAGGESGLPAPRPYTDYLKWLARRRSEPLLGFWKAHLQGLEAPTRLPFAQAADSARYQCRTLELPLGSAVSDLARRLRATPNSVAQSVWSILLRCYCGSADVVFGNVVSGRPADLEGVEGLVGLFINTVPLRVTHAPGESFAALVERAQASFRECEENGYASLAAVQRESGLEGALFDHVFVFENYPVDPSVAAGSSSVSLEELREQTNYGFNAILRQVGSQTTARFQYDGAAFPDEAVERIAGHFRQALEAVAADPFAPAENVELVGGRERERLLRDFNPGEAAAEPGRRLHELFEAQARLTPDAVALTCPESLAGSWLPQELTYAELDALSNRLAWKLREERSVGPDTLVGICLERSAEMIVALFGVLKAGGAYLPIDPGYPEERILFMLRDADARTLLVAGSSPVDASFGGAVWDLTDRRNFGERAEALPPIGGPADLAYVIYTSGSTGAPKGVMVEHRNVSRLLASCQPWYRFGEDDVWTLFHYFGFDFSVWEIFGALVFGGRLVVVPRWITRSPDRFYELLLDENVTVLNQTPSAFRLLIAEDAKHAAGARKLSLRHVIFGGEALEFETLRPWIARRGDESPQLANMYGITETTVHVTYKRVRAIDLETRAGSVVGLPIPGWRIRILDEQQKLLPIGVVGEIYVEGDGVARGYLNRAELTEQRFLESPFQPGARMYRTGDLARWLSDGNLEYHGRRDAQVKIRGHRIELGEIESALLRVDGVREAVAVAIPASEGLEMRLVAYYTSNASAEVTRAQLRDALRKTLPDYMLPWRFVGIERIPLTANGKVDRAQLPRPDEPQSLEPEFIAPSSELETRIAQIWKDLLRVDRVGSNENFFEIGGDSIKAIICVHKLKESLGAQVPIGMLAGDSLADIASLCERELSSSVPSPNA